MLLVTPNYGVCLRIFHPCINPEYITTCLGLIPVRFWISGKQRSTPKGTLLEGLNKETYWCHTFDPPDNIGLNDSLVIVFAKLSPHKYLFELIYSDGGHAEIYLPIRSGENAGDTIKFSTLESFANLKINFSLELFP
jgi:hypothetical protein